MLTYQASLTCCCLGREPIRFLSSLPGSAMASSPNAMKRPASAEAEAEPDIAKKRRVFSGVQDEAHLAGSFVMLAGAVKSAERMWVPENNDCDIRAALNQVKVAAALFIGHYEAVRADQDQP